MANRDDPFNDQWEDLVRRLGGTADQAHAPPPGQPEAPDGPRDYTLSPETVDDFQPPVPRPMAAGNPRTILSWVGVLGAAACWILAGLLGWPMPWWLRTLTVLAFLGGGLSLFFLLPKPGRTVTPLMMGIMATGQSCSAGTTCPSHAPIFSRYFCYLQVECDTYRTHDSRRSNLERNHYSPGC